MDSKRRRLAAKRLRLLSRNLHQSMRMILNLTEQIEELVLGLAQLDDVSLSEGDNGTNGDEESA